MTNDPHSNTLEALQAAPYTALADVYDLIMAEVEYDEWADLILRVASGHGFRGGLLLDLGCGTGNATLPMWERGYEVEGIDASGAMLEVARRKMPGVEFTLGTFEGFELPRRYALVYSVFDALNNLLTDAAFTACLNRVHEHLTPGGVFMFDVNTSAGLRELWHGGVAEGWADDVYYRWSHAYDDETGLATVAAYCETPDSAFTELHRERGYDEPHLRLLLEAAGFEAVAVIDSDGEPPPPEAERIWVVARRPGE